MYQCWAKGVWVLRIIDSLEIRKENVMTAYQNAKKNNDYESEAIYYGYLLGLDTAIKEINEEDYKWILMWKSMG